MSWETVLQTGGILLTEDTAMKTLVQGLREKEQEAGIVLTTDPSSSYTAIFSRVEGSFCSSFDQALIELAPNFLNNSNQPYAADLMTLAEAVGDNRVITCYVDNNAPFKYQANITAAYISQRAAMLNLLVTPAFDIYSLPVIVKSAKVILPTNDYVNDPTGEWTSEDITIASVTNAGVVTVVSEGTCQLNFVGDGTGVSGTITVRCLLEPNASDNLIKQASINGSDGHTTYVGWCYNNAVETEYGVTVQFTGYKPSTGEFGKVVINGTMSQAATIPICPKNSYNFIGSYTHSDVEGDLLLWVEECSGTCTIDRGRVYVEFCTRHETSGKTTEGLYEVVLYSFDQPVQITRAKLIKNDVTSISGIRIFAPIGTVFDNYTIKIGIKKWSKSGITHNCGLLESCIQSINTYTTIATDTPFYRLQDGSFVIGTATAVRFLNYGQNGEFVTSLSSPYRASQYSTADILDSGVVIAEAGKILRFTYEVLDKDFDLGTGYICFGLLYADGNRAATIVYYDSANGGYSGKTSTSFIAEKDINTLFCGVKATTISTSPQSLGLRVAFKLEEVNLDDLDLEGIELFNDVLMVNQGDVYVKYDPEAIVGSPIASELEWTSSNEDVATIDSNGHITIHSQGNVSFTATSVKHPEITATTSLIECYVSQGDNIIENLIKVRPNATYSQVGLTCTLNEDGTVTLNGTTTASDNTYIRNVIWPLGNSKTAWNVHFLRPGISGMLLVWFEYVSGSVDGVSSFSAGTKFSEVYIMNSSGTELTAIKIVRMVDLYSTASTHNFAMKSATNDTNGLRCIVFGCQFKKGTKFNNFRFKLGVKKITPLTYHASVLEAYMPALTKFVKMNPNNNTIWTRYPDGSIGGYLTESLTSFPTGSGYVRLTKDLSYNSSLSNLLTGDEIGVVGHNYRLTVNLITFKYDRINTTECKFGIAYTDGTTAVEVPIVDTSDYTSNTSNTVLSGSYTGSFLAEKPIDCVYQYYKNLKIKGNAEYFGIALDDLDAYTINAGQIVTINSATEYNQVIINSGGRLNITNGGIVSHTVVNDGANLYISSGGIVESVTENGGAAWVYSGGSANFESNTITNKTLNCATIHSGTTLTSCSVHSLYVYSSGSAINTTILDYGDIKSQGYASAIELDSDNCAYLEVYGTIDNVIVNSGTELDIYDNGSAVNILENGGCVWCDDGVDCTFASNTINNFEITGGWTTVHENTIINNAIINDNDDQYGGLEIYEGGIASDVTISRGELAVYSGGTAYDIDHIPGYGSEDIEDGAIVTYKSSYAGVYYASNYELVSSALVMSNLNIAKAETCVVLSGGAISSTTINSSGLVKVQASGLADNNVIKNKGQLDITSGGIACNTTVSSGGKMYVYSSGVMDGTNKICSGGYVYFQSGASVIYDLRSRVPEDSAIMQIESGATATTLNQVNPKTVIVDEDQTRGSYALVSSYTAITSADTFDLYNTSNTYLGTISSGTIVYAGRNQYSIGLTNYTLILNKVFWLPPISSGYIVSSGEVLEVPTGEWYSCTTIESGGSVSVASGASMDYVTVEYGASMGLTGRAEKIKLNGGYVHGYISPVLGNNSYLSNSFSGYVYASGISGTVLSGTTGTDLMINPGGALKVLISGSATVIENGGEVAINENPAFITFSKHVITGSAIYSSGWKATIHSGTTMMAYDQTSGSVQVLSGGVLSNCNFSSAYIQADSGAIVNSITIKWGTNINVYSGAIVTNLSKTGAGIYVAHDGVLSNMSCLETNTHQTNVMRIDSGGKLTGKLIWTDGKLRVWSGGVIDFNITSQYPHSTIMTGFSRADSPFEPTYTITVGSGYYGPFILADDFPEDYIGSIVMCDTTGTSVGEIYPNSSATVDDIPYNLEFESGLLTLTKQGRMLYVSGSNVELSSGDIYDYAYVVSGDLVVSSGASVGFVNTEYTGYVNKLKWGGIGAVRENGGRFNYVDASPIAPNVVSGLNVTTVSKNISLHSGTTGVDITLGSGLSCYLAGGTINNMTVQNGGIVAGGNPGGHVIDGLVFESGGYLQLYGRGINATNIVITNDTTWAIDNFPDNVIQITSGGSTQYFTSSGFVNNLTVGRGCSLYNYAIASDVTVDSGYIRGDSNFIIDNLYLTSAANNNTTIADFIRGIANRVTLFKGKVNQQAPNLCSNTILSGGSWEQRTFNWMINTEIKGGVLNMAGMHCSNFDATISSGGTMFVKGYASNVIVSSGGSLIVSSGATAVNVVSNTDAFVTSNIGAYVTYTSSTTPGVFTIISSGQSVTMNNENSSGYIVAGGGNFVITNNAVISRVLCLGSTTILSSGSAYDIIINANTDVAVKTRGYVSGAKVYGVRANIHISSGGTGENVRTYTDGNILLSSGGFVSSAWISGWFDMYGGSASSVYVRTNNSQGMRIRPGASAYGVDIVSDGKVQIFNNGYAKGVVVSSGGILIVSSGGTAYDVDSCVDARITVSTGGMITYVNNPAYTYLSGGESIVVSDVADTKYNISSGRLTVKDNGVVSDTICQCGTVVISSGGVASNTILRGGTLVVANGVADTVSANCFKEGVVTYIQTIYVSSGGTVLNLDIDSSVKLSATADGLVDSALIRSGASVSIYDNGSMNNATIVGSVSVGENGVLSDASIRSGGYLNVASGGTALNVTYIPTEGTIYVSDGGYVTYANTIDLTGVYYGSNGTLVSHADSMSNKTLANNDVMEVFDSGVATVTTINSGGSVKIHSNGTMSSATIKSAGKLYISSGGTVDVAAVNSGGTMTVLSGGTATQVSAHASAYLKFYIAPDTYITGSRSGSSFEFINGTCASYALGTWEGFNVLSGCSLNSVTVNHLDSAYVSSGASINTAILRGSQLFLHIYNGAAATNIVVSGGNLSIDGVATSIINSGGSVNISSGAIVDNVVASGGSVYISSGATATNVIENGGYVGANSEANVTFVSNAFEGLTLSGWGMATVHSNTVASNIILTSQKCMQVYPGGIAESVTANMKCCVSVQSGGTALIKENCGYVKFDDGANVTFISNHISGSLLNVSTSATIHSGTIMEDVTLSSNFVLEVYSDGICSNPVVSSGILKVYSGGTALNVDYYPLGICDVISHEGAYVTYTSQYTGVMCYSDSSRCIVDALSNVSVSWNSIAPVCAMDSGILDTADMTGGRLYVRSGGVIRNVSVHVSNDAAYLNGYAGGLFENISMTADVMGYCAMYLYPQASASNIIVGEQAQLIVSSGATAIDVVENGGCVSAVEGATITFASHVISELTSNISRVTIHSNTTISGAELKGTPGWAVSYCVYGGVIKDAIISGNYIYVSDGYMSNVTLTGGPYRITLCGSELIASDIVLSNGNAYLTDGSFTNVRISAWTMISNNVHIDNAECRGFVQIGDGTINNLDIDSSGQVVVGSGCVITSINIHEGIMQCNSGCVISDVVIYDKGNLHVSSNTTVSNIVVSSNGTLLVHNTGSALNVISNTGAIISALDGAYITYV